VYTPGLGIELLAEMADLYAAFNGGSMSDINTAGQIAASGYIWSEPNPRPHAMRLIPIAPGRGAGGA
jgi:hypothetical protein